MHDIAVALQQAKLNASCPSHTSLSTGDAEPHKSSKLKPEGDEDHTHSQSQSHSQTQSSSSHCDGSYDNLEQLQRQHEIYGSQLGVEGAYFRNDEQLRGLPIAQNQEVDSLHHHDVHATAKPLTSADGIERQNVNTAGNFTYTKSASQLASSSAPAIDVCVEPTKEGDAVTQPTGKQEHPPTLTMLMKTQSQSELIFAGCGIERSPPSIPFARYQNQSYYHQDPELYGASTHTSRCSDPVIRPQRCLVSRSDSPMLPISENVFVSQSQSDLCRDDLVSASNLTGTGMNFMNWSPEETPANSANTTESVRVTSSFHVAEIVGKQGNINIIY